MVRVDVVADMLPPHTATASYRLLPTITLLEAIPEPDQLKFQSCFPSGVIDITKGQVIVADARRDTVSREVLRHPEFENKVKLGRVRDHFICEFTSTSLSLSVSLHAWSELYLTAAASE